MLEAHRSVVARRSMLSTPQFSVEIGSSCTKLSRKSSVEIMSTRLDASIQVSTLARDLGLQQMANPVAAISKFCDQRMAGFLDKYPHARTLDDLVEVTAAELGTRFEVVRRDADLSLIVRKYVSRSKREPAFANLEREFRGSVLGITCRLLHPEPWESPFVSIIDCRGDKAARGYFTKWHELAHLLVLTDQGRLSFRRTHSHAGAKDAEESLVDIIAGHVGFYPPIIRQNATGRLTFESLQTLRARLCPGASREAAVIGFVQAWPTPCLYLKGELRFRKSEEESINQDRFVFAKSPSPQLRVVTLVMNDSAKALDTGMHKNIRIPAKSVIYDAFNDMTVSQPSNEDFSWWETSEGGPLASGAVLIESRKSWDSVEAFLHPILPRKS